MTTATVLTKVNEWEQAWADYVEALERFDETFPNRHRRGQVRLHNRSKTLLGKARERLEKLDPTGSY